MSDLSDMDSIFIENPRKIIDTLIEFKSEEIPVLVASKPNEFTSYSELKDMMSDLSHSDYSQPKRTCFGSNMESLRQYLSMLPKEDS